MIYKLGIFILGAGIAWTLSIYILHPTTSAVFFVCILCGVAVGTLGVRYAKEVIIVGTSLLGGVMAGFALSKLGKLPEIPYGILLSIGFALLGLLIQFATNRSEDAEEEEAKTDSAYDEEREKPNYDDYEDDYDLEDDYLEEDIQKTAKRQPVKSRRGNVPDIRLEKPEKKRSGR